jgi:hypothetical protein
MLGRCPGSQFKLSDKYGESTKKPRKLRGESEKATVGVEPTMSDLQWVGTPESLGKTRENREFDSPNNTARRVGAAEIAVNHGPKTATLPSVVDTLAAHYLSRPDRQPHELADGLRILLSTPPELIDAAIRYCLNRGWLPPCEVEDSEPYQFPRKAK